jgi:uncharacterized membrane protein YkvA (DUF1232 family)
MIDRLLPNILSPGYWRKTWQELRLVWQLLRDPRVPKYLKALPAIVLAYLLSPFDLIPGFLPVIGQLDDFAFLLMALKVFTYLAPSDLVGQHKRKMNLDRVEV